MWCCVSVVSPVPVWSGAGGGSDRRGLGYGRRLVMAVSVVGDRFRRTESGRWVRREPGELSGGGGAYVWAVSDADGSPGFVGYVPECGWCWLGAPHTVREHDRRIGGEA